MAHKDDDEGSIANNAHHEYDEEHDRYDIRFGSIGIRSVTVGRFAVVSAFLGRKIIGRQYAAGRHVDNQAGQTHCVWIRESVCGQKFVCVCELRFIGRWMGNPCAKREVSGIWYTRVKWMVYDYISLLYCWDVFIYKYIYGI